MSEPFKYYDPKAVEKDGGYHLEWTPAPYEEIVRQVADAIANDRDGKIKRALIDLGWTPPSDAP